MATAWVRLTWAAAARLFAFFLFIPFMNRPENGSSMRSIANAITVEWKDGNKIDEIAVEYPIGHRRRRNDAVPLLVDKFRANAATQLPTERVESLSQLTLDPGGLDGMPAAAFMDRWIAA